MSYTALSRTHAAGPAKGKAKAPAGGLWINDPNDTWEQEANRIAGTPGPTGEREACREEPLQRKGSNRCVSGINFSLSGISIIQPKLTIGSSNDPLEQEADRIADQVTAPTAFHAVSRTPLRIQRFSGQPTGQIDRVPASVDQVLASAGRPLEPALRQDMEHRFGYDFSRVRVHTDVAAEQSAREVNARAFTAGHNIVFGAGRFAPQADAGRSLLAHELSHVVQQGCGTRKPGKARLSLSASPSGYVQRAPLPPRLEDQIVALMEEHPGLSRINAERALQGPNDTIAELSGKSGKGAIKTGSGEQTQVADLKFYHPTQQPSERGRSVVLRREVKTWKGNQGKFSNAVSEGADQLQEAGVGEGNVQAGGGGELLVQAPAGTNAIAALRAVKRFRGSVMADPEGVQKFGRYRSVKITIVDPSGKVLFDGPLEFPPSEISPSAGGGKGIAPVAPRAQTTQGEFATGKPTGVTASGGGEGIAPVAPRAQATQGEITSKISAGGGKGIAPVAPRAQTTQGEFATGKPTGVTASGGGEGIAPVAPRAQATQGEIITVPEGASMTPAGGGPGKAVTTARGESMVPQRPSIGRGIAGAVGQAGLGMAIALIGGKILAHFDEKRIQNALDNMKPQIETDLNRLQPEVEKLLQQTNMRQTVYASIKVDVVYGFMIDPEPGSGPLTDYQYTKLVGVDVSTEDINQEDLIREPLSIGGHNDHHVTTYSVPIAEPAALVLPYIYAIHKLLAMIRTDLTAARGGTTGEVVALDYLEVAQQATDFADSSPLRNNPPAERFHATVDAITRSLSVLEGPSRQNAALQGLTGRLRLVEFMVNGLGPKWLVMVKKPGQAG